MDSHAIFWTSLNPSISHRWLNLGLSLSNSFSVVLARSSMGFMFSLFFNTLSGVDQKLHGFHVPTLLQRSSSGLFSSPVTYIKFYRYMFIAPCRSQELHQGCCDLLQRAWTGEATWVAFRNPLGLGHILGHWLFMRLHTPLMTHMHMSIIMCGTCPTHSCILMITMPDLTNPASSAM